MEQQSKALPKLDLKWCPGVSTTVHSA